MSTDNYQDEFDRITAWTASLIGEDIVGEWDWRYVLDAPEFPEFGRRGHNVPLTPADIAEITHLWARSGDYAELEIAALMQLRDGRWASLVAWCDTTGWGCQDGIDWKVCVDRQAAISQGLDLESRRHLGLLLPGECKGVAP